MITAGLNAPAHGILVAVAVSLVAVFERAGGKDHPGCRRSGEVGVSKWLGDRESSWSWVGVGNGVGAKEDREGHEGDEKSEEKESEWVEHSGWCLRLRLGGKSEHRRESGVY